jgi:hypothetical protein
VTCQAIVEDYERPRYHASMQRIIVPGEKPCSRRGVEQVGPLCLCKTHARLAREGFVSERGEVAGRNDRREIREYQRRHGRSARLHTWAPEADG